MKKLNITNKNIFKILGILGFGVLLYFMYFILMNNIGVNSDDSVLFLRAKDILDGNIFLKNWYGATTHGIFSWAFSGVLGILLGGFNISAIYHASAILYAINTLLLLKLIYDYKKQLFPIFIAICLFIFRMSRYMNSMGQFGHADMVAYVISIMILLQLIYSKSDNKKYIVMFYVLMIMVNMTDALCSYIFTIPLIIATLIKYFQTKEKINLHVFISSFFILISSRLLARILSLNGIHQFYETYGSCFCSFEDIWNNISVTIQAFMYYFNAHFFDQKIFLLQTCCQLIGFVLMVISILILFYNIKHFFEKDIVDQVLVLGIIIQTLAFTFFNMCNFESRRYVICPVLYLLILVCRYDWNSYVVNLKNKLENVNFNVSFQFLKVVLMLFFIVIPIAKIPSLPKKSQTEYEYNKIATVLQDKNLTNGYANFWHAHVVTLASEGRVQVSNIVQDNLFIGQYYWFSKSDWYKSPANFVIVSGDEGDIDYVDKEKFINVLGEPKEVLDIDNYSILIYDYDISKKVNSDYNVFKFGSQLGHNSEISHCIDKKLILNNNDMQFGPSVKLNKGKYKVTIIGENLQNGAFDVYSNKENKIFEINNVNVTPTKVTYEVQINKNVNDIEFRCYNNSNDDILINSLNATYESDK